MKKLRLTLIVSWVVVLTVLLAVPVAAGSSGDEYGGNGNALDTNLAVPGDIFVVKGIKKMDWAVPGYWPHTAMYVGGGMIVEGWQGGARYLPVSVINTADEAALLRVNTTQSVRDNAVQFHMDRIGIPYDYWWMSKQIYGSSYYCSELNWAGYKYQGVEIDRNPGYHWLYQNSVAPQEIVDSSNTYIISRSN